MRGLLVTQICIGAYSPTAASNGVEVGNRRLQAHLDMPMHALAAVRLINASASSPNLAQRTESW